MGNTVSKFGIYYPKVQYVHGIGFRVVPQHFNREGSQDLSHQKTNLADHEQHCDELVPLMKETLDALLTISERIEINKLVKGVQDEIEKAKTVLNDIRETLKSDGPKVAIETREQKLERSPNPIREAKRLLENVSEKFRSEPDEMNQRLVENLRTQIDQLANNEKDLAKELDGLPEKVDVFMNEMNDISNLLSSAGKSDEPVDFAKLEDLEKAERVLTTWEGEKGKIEESVNAAKKNLDNISKSLPQPFREEQEEQILAFASEARDKSSKMDKLKKRLAQARAAHKMKERINSAIEEIEIMEEDLAPGQKRFIDSVRDSKKQNEQHERLCQDYKEQQTAVLAEIRELEKPLAGDSAEICDLIIGPSTDSLKEKIKNFEIRMSERGDFLKKNLKAWNGFEELVDEISRRLDKIEADKGKSKYDSLQVLEKHLSVIEDNKESLVKTEELRETLAEKCFNELEKACSPSGEKNLADEMSDLKSRQDAAITQLDRKIKALRNLRSQWSETESLLHELSKELEENEQEYAQLDAQSKADGETRQAPQTWYQQLTEFEAKLPLFEPRLRKCDDSIVQLESHTEPGSSLKTRAANLRARWETLSDASKTLLSLGSELVSAGQRIRNNLATVRGNLNAAEDILRVVEESEISQADEIVPLKEENTRAGLLLDSSLGTLSTVKAHEISAQVQEEIEELESKAQTLKEKQSQFKSDLTKAHKIWLESDENFRIIQAFIDRASVYDVADQKIAVNPIQWQSDISAIKSLQSEYENIQETPDLLRSQVDEICKLCNCEADRMTTKAASLEVVFTGIPQVLEDMVEKIQEVKKTTEQFAITMDRKMNEVLRIDSKTRSQKTIQIEIIEEMKKTSDETLETLSAAASVDEVSLLVRKIDQLIPAEDFRNISGKLDEFKELSERVSLLLKGRKRAAEMLGDLQARCSPLMDEIEKFTVVMKENGEFDAEMIQDCKNITEELVDALKIAINFDNQAHQGHLQFVFKEQTILARQLITRLDERVEEILQFASLQNSSKESKNLAYDNFKRRTEELEQQILDLQDEVEELEKAKEMSQYSKTRKLAHMVEQLSNFNEIEMKSIRTKGEKICQERKELSDEVNGKIDSLQKLIDATSEEFTDFRQHLTELHSAENEYKDEIATIKQLLKNVEKVIGEIKEEDVASNVVSSLRKAREDLEAQQENADKLKKSKNQIKVKTLELSQSLVLKNIPTEVASKFEKDSSGESSDEESSKSNASSIELLTDQYMDLQDQVEELIQEYENTAKIDENISEFENTVDAWARQVAHELNNNLDGSKSLSERLEQLPMEIEDHEAQLEHLRSSGQNDSQKTTLNEIAKRLERSKTLFAGKIKKLEFFEGEHGQLLAYIADLDSWLSAKENTLLTIEKTNRADNIPKCKEINSELIKQRDNVEQAKDHLNSLCRNFHGADKLEETTTAVTGLVRKYETVCKLSLSVLNKLEQALVDEFTKNEEKFLIWKKRAQESIAEAQDVAGESHEIQSKIDALEEVLESQGKVEGWLKELAESNDFDASKPEKHVQDFKGIIREAKHYVSVLKDASIYVSTLEDNRIALQTWLEKTKTKLDEHDKDIDDVKEVDSLIEALKDLKSEVDAKKDVFKTLQQQVMDIADGDIGTVPGKRIQLTVNDFNNLEKKVGDKLRNLVSFEEQLNEFNISKENLRKWIKSILDRVSTLDADLDNVSSVTECQNVTNLVDLVLLEKQEGEVKIHKALGRAERLCNFMSPTGRTKQQEDMDIMKHAFEELVDKLENLRAKSELRSSELSQLAKSCVELENTLADIEAVLEEDPPVPSDFKEKKQRVERLIELENDLNEVEAKITASETLMLESGYQTNDFTSEHPGEPVNMDMSTASSVVASNVLAPLTNRVDVIRADLNDKIRKASEIRDRHERWIVAGDELEEWINSAKEELSRWSDLVGEKDRYHLQKKVAKIEELQKAKIDGLARLEATVTLAESLENDTAPAGYDLIATETKQQKASWKEWEASIDEASESISHALAELEEYQDGFQKEQEKIEFQLKEFSEDLNAISLPTSEDITEKIPQLVEAEHKMKKLSSKQNPIRTQLNVLCRKFANEDATEISEAVTQTLSEFTVKKTELGKIRNEIETDLRSQFKLKSSQFDSFIRRHTAQLQQLSTPRGDLEGAQKIIIALNELTGACLEQGNEKLKDLNNLADKGTVIFISEQVNLNRSTIRQLKEKWKHFVSELDEAKQSVVGYIDGLKDFDKSCFELFHWLSQMESRLKAESGLKATIGLKKSNFAALQAIDEETTDEQYKFLRLKRKAVKVQYPGGTLRVGELQTSYRSLCHQSSLAKRDAQTRLQQHMTLVTEIAGAEEWIKERQQCIDSLNPGLEGIDKNGIEKRLKDSRRIANEQQTGEGMVQVALSRLEMVLQGTSQNGKHAVQLQAQSLKEVWSTFLNSLRHSEEKLSYNLQQWSLWEDAITAANSWLSKAAKNLDERVGDTSDSDNSESTISPTLTMHRLKTIVDDFNHHGNFFCIEQLDKQTKHLTAAIGPCENAAQKVERTQEKYRILLAAANEKLQISASEAELLEDRRHALRDFTDWLADQRPIVVGFMEPTGGDIETSLAGLVAFEAEVIPEGDAKCNILETECQDAYNNPIIDEWQQLKSSVKSGICELNERKTEIELLRKSVRDLLKWLESQNDVLKDSNRNKIIINEDKSNNAPVIVSELQSMVSEFMAKKETKDAITETASQLMDKSRLDLAITIEINDLSTKFQNLFGQTKSKLKSAELAASALQEISLNIEDIEQWIQVSNETFIEAITPPENIPYPGDHLEEVLQTLHQLITECETRRAVLVGLVDKCDRVVAGGNRSPLSESTICDIKKMGKSVNDSYQEFYAKLQSAQRRTTKTRAHWCDYDHAQKHINQFLEKAEKKLNANPIGESNELGQLKKKQAELSAQIKDHAREKEKFIEAEFRLGKMPLEIQDKVAPHFYKQQGRFKELGRELRRQADEVSKGIDAVNHYLAEIQKLERTMFQLSFHIGELEEQILNCSEPALERESQATILLQDVEAFQKSVSASRAAELDDSRYQKMQPLVDAANGMHQKVAELLAKCQRDIVESKDRNTEVKDYMQTLSKARNAISNMPKAQDQAQATRQLDQLENIKFDMQEIIRWCEEFTHEQPDSQEGQNVMNEAKAVDQQRLGKVQSIKKDIEKWDHEQETIADIDAWLHKAENQLESLTDLHDSGSSFEEAVPILEAKAKDLNIIIHECMDFKEKLNELDQVKEVEQLKARLEVLQERAEKELDEMHESIEAAKGIQVQIVAYNQELEQLQSEFSENSKIDKNSETRLARFEELVDRAKGITGPISKVITDLGSIRSLLQPTQYENGQTIVNDQKSRLVDIISRSENRSAHLRDLINEKCDFVKKLAQFIEAAQKKLAETTIPVEQNSSIAELEEQLKKACAAQQELAQLNSQFQQLRQIQLAAVKLGFSNIEQEEIDSTDSKAAEMLDSAMSAVDERIAKLEELKAHHERWYNQGRELNSWMDQAEKRMELRLKLFPVNPDSMAKLISHYKNFTRELLSRQKPLEELTAKVGSLKVLVRETAEDAVYVKDLEERYQKLRSECDSITKDLQHALAMRELCNADFNRVKRWLQEAEVQLTPESSAGTIAELETQLKEQWIDQPQYNQLEREIPEIANVLRTVKSKAHEISDTSPPQEINILQERIEKSKQKLDNIQANAAKKAEMTEKLITSRREYERTTGQVEAFLSEVAAKQSSPKEMSDLLDKIRPDIEELRSMKESLKQAGQPWQAERHLKLLTKFHQQEHIARELLAREQEIAKLKEEYECKYESAASTLDDIATPVAFSSMSSPKEDEIEKKLACCHVTIADLAKLRQDLKEITILAQKLGNNEPNRISQINDKVGRHMAECNAIIRECQSKLAGLRDFSSIISSELKWLRETQIAITAPQSLPLQVSEVQKMIVRLNLLEDETVSRLDHLEKLLAVEEDERIPDDERDNARKTLETLKPSLLSDFDSQKKLMSEALSARQTYAERLNSVSGQLGAASARLDLIESDCNGFVMPDQDELKFTDQELEDVQSVLIDKLNEFEAASQCLSLSPSTNHLAQDRVKEAITIIRQKANQLLNQASGMKSDISDAAAAWQSCEKVINEIREELKMADQFCNNYKDANSQNATEATNLAEAFRCYTDEMSKCCEERLEQLDQVAAALGSQQSLLSAYEVLNERWDETKSNAAMIRTELEAKASRWSIVEPMAAKIESSLDEIANALEKERSSGFKSSENKFEKLLDRSNETIDEILQLEHMSIPLGHVGTVLHQRLHSRAQYQKDLLEDLVKDEIDSAELKEAAFKKLNQLKSWFDENLLSVITDPSDLEHLEIDQLKSLHRQICQKEKEVFAAGKEAAKLYSDKTPPKELGSMISSLQREFSLAKKNIESACSQLRSTVAKREEAGVKLVTLMTALQDAELQLSDPVGDDTDLKVATKKQEKLHTKLDELHLELLRLDAEATSGTKEDSVLPEVLKTACQQMSRVQQLADLRDKQLEKAAEKDEEVESLLRKADHLATLATSELNTIERDAEPEMNASTIDQKYFELVALADRLSGVSKQLKEESKKRRPMEQQLSLAADSANCTSSRLRARADKLRELSSNAKSWGSDIREAQDKLVRSVNKPLTVSTPVIQITPPNDTPSPMTTSSKTAVTSKLSPEASYSEVERLRKKLRSFTFADLGESKLLSQQLEDYKELHKQLKAAVQSAKMSQKISEVSNPPKKHSPRFSNKSISPAASSALKTSAPALNGTGDAPLPQATKLEPLLVVASNNSAGASAEYWTNNDSPQSSWTPRVAPSRSPASIKSPATISTSPQFANGHHAQGPPTNRTTTSSTRSLKSTDLAAALEQLTFAPEFQRLCQNSATALDECEQVLQTQSGGTLDAQMERADLLSNRLDDIYPDLEKCDDQTSSIAAIAPDFNSQNIAKNISSMLLDRWDTVRMRVAQQQNAIEIQMLESEQYRRMVDGYKSEQESPTSAYSIITN